MMIIYEIKLLTTLRVIHIITSFKRNYFTFTFKSKITFFLRKRYKFWNK